MREGGKEGGREGEREGEREFATPAMPGTKLVYL